MIKTGEARALKMINKTGDPAKDEENYALAQKEASCWAPLKHVNSKLIILLIITAIVILFIIAFYFIFIIYLI